MNDLRHHIKTLSVNRKLRSDYNLSHLENLSKVNIFVGSNNSGKSRFLRGVFSLNKSLTFMPPEEMVDMEEYYNILRDFIDAIISSITAENSILGIGELDVNQLINEIRDLEYIPMLKENKDLFSDFHRLVGEINKLGSSSPLTLNSNREILDDVKSKIVTKLKELTTDYRLKMDEFTHSGKMSYKINFKRVYIPTLRGLRGYVDTIDTGKDIYKERTKNDYFKEEPESLEIHTGLNLYDEITDMLLGSVQQRHNMVKFQKFLGESFFDGQEVTITPVRNSDIIKVKIGAESEKKHI